MGLTFIEWLDANHHNPTAWQRSVAEIWDAPHTAAFGPYVGRRWGKTWILDRYAEYREEQA